MISIEKFVPVGKHILLLIYGKGTIYCTGYGTLALLELAFDWFKHSPASFTCAKHCGTFFSAIRRNLA